jgi:tetratricopeptide (TPR) repeat protein
VPDTFADRVIAYLDAEVKTDPGDAQGKLRLVQALLAMDRPKDLAERLRQWIAAGDATGAWRIALGYLSAEEGRLADAIKLFEAVRAADGLLPDEYRALAGWYAATNQREAHDRTVLAMFEAMSADQLSEWISRQLETWQNAETPPRELSAEVPMAFRATLRKSSRPADEMQNLWEFYRTTRDFRLLSALAESVTGCTAEQVYGLLEAIGEGLTEVNEEATVDALVQHVAQNRARSINEVDRRALDLLEALVERRAAALKDQPGVHADQALAALRRAWKPHWAPGEPRLMAHLLESLGKESDEGLAVEQLHDLESLLRDAPRGSEDRLDIAACTARTLWAQSRRDEAIDRLEAALKEQQEAGESGLDRDETGMFGVPSPGKMGILPQLIEYLKEQQHFARGEAVLKKLLEHPGNQQQAEWFTDRLYGLYEKALAADGEVSLGRGATLYHAVEQKLQGEFVRPGQPALLHRLFGLYTTANRRGVPGVADDLKRFAFRRLPELLRRPSVNYQWNNYPWAISETANTLYAVAGPRDALAFLVERFEAEPVWAQRAASLGQYAYLLDKWAAEVRDLGDLEPRLLRVRLNELRQRLQRQDPNNRQLGNEPIPWMHNRAAFVKVAEEVLAENKDSGDAAACIADWLYNMAGSHARAIEILLDARRRQILDRAGQARLATFLMEQGRYADALPVLDGLVGHADDLPWRVQLMQAYFKTKQPERLAELLQKTDARFRSGGGWQDGAMAALGKCCLDCELLEQAAGYYREAIAHYQRGRKDRVNNGSDDKTLTAYYCSLATACLRLGKSAEAIDAAAAAVLSLPPDQRDPNLLAEVIGKVPDLDGCVARLDRQARETGLDSPLVRREIGREYSRRGERATGLEQLRLAVELQPGDAETRAALLECYDGAGDKWAAIGEMLRWRDFARRDFQLYADLAERFQAIDQPEEAERARMSIVECLPAEAESHKMLAEILQNEGRWAEASRQWEQVARIRALEPAGLLGLAAAQIHEKRWPEAQATLKKLRQTAWPARFGEVGEQIRGLEQELAAGMGK